MACEDRAGGVLGIKGVGLPAQPPVAAVSAHHLDDTDVSAPDRAGQPGTIRAGALDGEGQPPAQTGGSVQQLGIATGVGRERPALQDGAEVVNRDRDVDILVGVAADDDSTVRRDLLHAHQCLLQPDQRTGRVTLAGRVDGTVTRPVAIRLL